MLKRLRRWLFGGPPAPGASFAPERPAEPPPRERAPAPNTTAEPPAESLPSGLPFEIRPYRDGDAAALARVFRDAILVTAADHYDADQRRAWSAAADDPALVPTVGRDHDLLREEHVLAARVVAAAEHELVEGLQGRSNVGVGEGDLAEVEDARLEGEVVLVHLDAFKVNIRKR